MKSARFGGGSLEQLRPWLGAQWPGPHPGSAELHGAQPARPEEALLQEPSWGALTAMGGQQQQRAERTVFERTAALHTRLAQLHAQLPPQRRLLLGRRAHLWRLSNDSTFSARRARMCQ